MDEILSLIPQRKPFLFVDKIVERKDNYIRTEKTIIGDEYFFEGHFPGNPIMPGVLLCEAIFQTGALLMSGTGDKKLGVVTRINNSKFKGIVRPKDRLELEVELVEKLENAYYMKGKITVSGKIVMTTDFTCASISE